VNNFKQNLPVFISILLAWMLMIVHLPNNWHWFRPEWLILVVIYWVFTRPQIVGVGIAWFAGLGMDILGGGLLGQYALALSIVAYFAHQLRYRSRLFPFWQQAFVILVLVGIAQLILLTVQWLVGHPPRSLWYWSSTLSSVIVWPWGYRLLRYYEYRRTL
jgi:rod shape-determining protein MreD